MKKPFSLCKSDMLIFGVLCSMMILPAMVFAHGWKAPPDAARITNPIQMNSASIKKGRQV
ncbi:MAG: hypothetical protein ABFS43_11735 [Thermodesulfobacteriota bacterium]